MRPPDRSGILPARTGRIAAAVLLSVLLAGTAVAAAPVAARSSPSATAPLALLPRAPDAANATYLVSFVEFSLPLGATWYVNITGLPSLTATVTIATGTAISTELSNGTYNYTATTNERYFTAGGERGFNVSGATVSQNLLFTIQAGIYQILFLENGVAGGTNWSATFNGTTETASAPNAIVFYEPNGSYHYSIGVVPGYTSNLTVGNTTIHGVGIVYSVGFTGPPSPGPSSAAAFPWTWLLGGLIAGGLIVFVMMLLVRRRSGPDENPDGESGETPPVPPPESGS